MKHKIKSISKNTTYERNTDISMYEELYILKHCIQNKKIALQSNPNLLFKKVVKANINLTNIPYKKENRNTIKNGINVIHNIPYHENKLLEETQIILEWIYKKMYIENKREVDFEKMKKSYFKDLKEKRLYQI